MGEKEDKEEKIKQYGLLQGVTGIGITGEAYTALNTYGLTGLNGIIDCMETRKMKYEVYR
jgi:hypothetical protein